MKTFDLNFLVWNSVRYEYFYQREKNDRNGNSRYRVHLIDPEAKAVHEMLFKCYECQIENSLKLKLDRLIDAEED